MSKHSEASFHGEYLRELGIADDGDVAGVVAAAMLLTCVSGMLAIVATLRQRRAQSRTVRL